MVVALDSWTCGNYLTGSNPCTTDASTGYTYPESMTFTIYNAGSGGTAGSVITTDTQTFNIPFRPSADPGTGPGECGAGSSEWYDPAEALCHNGLATTVTFNAFGSVTLPSTVVYGYLLQFRIPMARAQAAISTTRLTR